MHVETRVTVRARDADVVVAGLRHAGLRVEDTGERITTEDGLDGEIVLALAVPAEVVEGATEEAAVAR